MIEPTQVLLFGVVTVLTIVLVFIGWQIFQILSEIRKMLQEQKSELELIKKQLNNTFLEKIKRFTELENYIISHSAKSKKDS